MNMELLFYMCTPHAHILISYERGCEGPQLPNSLDLLVLSRQARITPPSP